MNRFAINGGLLNGDSEVLSDRGPAEIVFGHDAELLTGKAAPSSEAVITVNSDAILVIIARPDGSGLVRAQAGGRLEISEMLPANVDSALRELKIDPEVREQVVPKERRVV